MARSASGRLKTYLSASPVGHDTLPFVHVTRAYAFDDMLLAGNLEPIADPDSPFAEPLIYLFYGRPAYRAKHGSNARLEYEWPIVFIFDPETLNEIKRVYPFDTGAFHLNVYKEFFDPTAILEDFELEPVLDSAKKVVSTLYTSNKEYFDGNSRKNFDIPHRQFEAQGLMELARLPGAQASVRQRDERSSAIEIQTTRSINLKTSLLAIIIPEPYLDDNEIKQALKRWEVKVIKTYGTLHGTNGELWAGQIYQLVRDIYIDMKIL